MERELARVRRAARLERREALARAPRETGPTVYDQLGTSALVASLRASGAGLYRGEGGRSPSPPRRRRNPTTAVSAEDLREIVKEMRGRMSASLSQQEGGGGGR